MLGYLVEVNGKPEILEAKITHKVKFGSPTAQVDISAVINSVPISTTVYFDTKSSTNLIEEAAMILLEQHKTGGENAS